MKTCFPTAIIVSLLLIAALGSVHIIAAQDTAILGYPYDTNGLSGGDAYSFYGARFILNGNATINSISCKLWISYDSLNSSAISHYRYAIYQDNAGSVGTLVAQTEIGSENIPVDGPYNNDKWRTLDLSSPISLDPGTYWLIEVGDSSKISIHNEPMTAEQHDIVLGILGSLNFPPTINKQTTSAPTIYSIYAIGQGVSSIMPPPTPDTSHPGVSTLLVNCQSAVSSSNKIEVFGNLTSYGAAIPQAPISFSYRLTMNGTWQQFAETNTSADGSFSANWTPPSPGSYMINATYWGDALHTIVFTATNVLISSLPGNQTQKVFSVDSNSTVTDLTFNFDNNELSFDVSGEQGTTGFTFISVDKSLATDPFLIQAYIDGNKANFTVQSTTTSWLLYFTYHHSTHNVMFALNRTESGVVPELPNSVLLVIIFLVVGAIVILASKMRPYIKVARLAKK